MRIKCTPKKSIALLNKFEEDFEAKKISKNS